GGDEAPKESVKFRFGAMGIQYIKQNPDGTEGTKMVGMWDLVTNKPDLNPTGLSGAPDFLKGTQ
ncbi:MAG: hypothetical protein JST11_31975, partial [Acidobacteria bacterium]|nr:hypothetical protein [Acidobacteriota bacterium]